ncbi:MAG: hypothetical protein R3266_13560 [Gemmatimonadota bacterium]|nr:hypothetical protein [Gemmatimonadota bacterium]
MNPRRLREATSPRAAASAARLAVVVGLGSAGVFAAAGLTAQAPEGWLLTGRDADDYELVRDMEVARSGEASLRLAARGNRHRDDWAVSVQMVDATPYRGRRVRLRGWLRSDDLGSGGLWMRIDGIVEGRAALLALDNMEDREIEGTEDWTEREIVLDVAPESVTILFGAMIAGDGALWVDDLAFEGVEEDVALTAEAEVVVDDAPYARPPGVHPAPTNLGFEREAGS